MSASFENNNSSVLSQAYFSALARGGLTAAVNYSTNLSFSQTQSPSSSQTRSNQKSTGQKQNNANSMLYTNNSQSKQYSNSSSNQKSNQSSTSKSNQNQYYQQTSRDQQSMLNIINQKRVQSLMSGNNLYPLEEESKEEEDSISVKLETLTTQNNHHRPSQLENPLDSDNSSSIDDKDIYSKQGTKKNPLLSQRLSLPVQQLQNNSNHQQNNYQSQNNLQQQINLITQNSKQSLMHSSSSMVSGDYDYNFNMEEAQMFEFMNRHQQCERVTPKIFDPQVEQVRMEEAYIQIDKGEEKDNRNNYEQMPLQQIDQNSQKVQGQLKKPTKFSKSTNSSGYLPVEQRLFDYQKKLQDKLDSQRRLQEQSELQQLRQYPQITEKSNEILMRKSMHLLGQSSNGQTGSNNTSQMQMQRSPRSNSHSPNNTRGLIKYGQSVMQNGNTSTYIVEGKQYYEDLQQKELQRLQLLQEKEMLGFTGKPQINKKSQSIKRKVNDLIEWKETQEKKRDYLLQQKQQQEQQEMLRLQKLRVVNKQSEKIVQERYQGVKKGRVEERLLRDAHLKQNKKQQNQQRKEVFYVQDLDDQNRKRSRSANQKASGEKGRNQNGKNLDIQQLMTEREYQREEMPLQMNEQHFNNQTQNLENPLQYNQQDHFQKTYENYPQDTYNNNYPLQMLSSAQYYQNQAQKLNYPQINQLKILQHPTSSQFYDQNMMANSQTTPLSQTSLPLQNFSNWTVFTQNSQLSSDTKSQGNNSQLNQHPSQEGVIFSTINSQHSQLSNNEQQQFMYQTIELQPQYTINQQPPHQQYYAQQIQQNKQKVENKKSGGCYQSLFDKIQKMNTSSCSSSNYQESSSGSQSVPVVSAHEMFVNNKNIEQQQIVNPIYQQIQSDYQQMTQRLGSLQDQQNHYENIQNPWDNQYSYDNNNNIMNHYDQQYLNINNTQDNDYYQKEYQAVNHQQQNIDYNQFISYQKDSSNKQVQQQSNPLYYHFQQQSMRQHQNNQDLIINKILDNSFIPSGYVKDPLRRQSSRTGSTHLHQETNQPIPQQQQVYQLEDIDQYYASRNTNSLNDQGVILDTEFITSESKQTNIVRNLTQVLDQEVVNTQQEQINRRDYSDNVMSQQEGGESKTTVFCNLKNLSFMERNSQWLEIKKQKLERVKEKQEQLVQRECPFKPQIKDKIQVQQINSSGNTSRSARSSSRSQDRKHAHSTSISSQDKNQSSTFSNQTLQQSSKQVQISVVDPFPSSTSQSYQTSSYQSQQSSESKPELVVATGICTIRIDSSLSREKKQMVAEYKQENFYPHEQNQQIVVEDSLYSQDCDISCLSPDKPSDQFQDSQNDITIDSVMSIGCNEMESVDRKNMAGFSKIINKKVLKF